MTMYNGINPITIHATRHKGLGYANTNPAGKSCWRVIDISESRYASVGPTYASKAELLADFDRYAATWGY